MRINWIIHLSFFKLVVLTPLGYVNYKAFGVLENTTVLLVIAVNSQFISQHVFLAE